MKIVGLTGGIGSGKTSVCKAFEKLHIPVFYADDEAKKLYTDANILQELSKIVGQNIIDEDGTLNKPLFSSIIFGNKAILEQVNAYVHPKVKDQFYVWYEQHNAPFCIREAAILIESGSYKDCDKIILVTAPLEERIKRVVKRDNTTYEAVKKRIENQLSEEEKKKFADYILENDHFELLENKVNELYKNLLRDLK